MKWWRVAGGSGGSLLKRATSSAASCPLPSRFSHSHSYQTIQAIPREHVGHRLAVKERAQGRIPAVVLDPLAVQGPSSRKQLLTADAKQIDSLMKNSPYACSTVYNLQVQAGPGSSVVLQSGTVIPIKVHKNEETGKILNLVMAWADEGAEMKVLVPVVYKGVNVCPGLKKGGYLHKIRESLKYLCPTEHIPQKIEVDLSNLDIGDRVLMHDVKVHTSLKLLSKNDTMPICKILAAKPTDPETQKATEAIQTSETTDL